MTDDLWVDEEPSEENIDRLIYELVPIFKDQPTMDTIHALASFLAIVIGTASRDGEVALNISEWAHEQVLTMLDINRNQIGSHYYGTPDNEKPH